MAQLPPLNELLPAIGWGAVVLLVMMMGSAIGEEVAGLLLGKVAGGFSQMLYMFLFIPIFVCGGYVYTLLNIPQTSPIATALFFGLWGFFTVFISRLIINTLNKFLGIRLPKSDKRHIDGNVLVSHLKAKKIDRNEIRNILRKACGSNRKADKLLEGGTAWVRIDPEVLTYELSKRGFSVHEVMDILKKVLKMKPEEAAMIWKNSGVEKSPETSGESSSGH